jgi:glutathione S-transferase
VRRSPFRGDFCCGDSPTLADCCLVPQLFNARRFDVKLDSYPTLLQVESVSQAMDAFARAVPDRQPDAA